LSRHRRDAAAKPFHDVGSADRIIRAPASQRFSLSVAAAIRSGTLQLTGRARATGPEKHTHRGHSVDGTLNNAKGEQSANA